MPAMVFVSGLDCDFYHAIFALHISSLAQLHSIFIMRFYSLSFFVFFYLRVLTREFYLPFSPHLHNYR